MNWTLPDLAQAMRLTLQDPAAGFRLLRQADPPLAARNAAMLLLAVLSALALMASVALSPQSLPQGMAQVLLQRPFAAAGMQWAGMILTAALIYRVGRMRGGTGSWPDAVLAVVWLQAILLVLQALQLIAVLILPLAADLLGLATVFLFFWLLTAFIAELHGFRSRGLVLLGVVLTIIGAALVLSLVMALFFGPMVPNV